MTLRSDIHTVVDDYVPPAPWLASVISDSIAAGHPSKRPGSKRRQRPLLAGVRAASLLAAALIAILLVVTVMVGGRVLRDRGGLGTNVAPASGIAPATLSQLRARPLKLPVVPPGNPLIPPDACPLGPVTTSLVGPGLNVVGTGPVYWTSSSSFRTTQWGTYADGTMYTEVGLSGPVLVRGIEFGTHRPLVFVGQYATGPIGGTDTLFGKKVEQHSELVVNASNPDSTTTQIGSLVVWRFLQGAALGQSGCFGLQFDGPGFTEVVVSTFGDAERMYS